MYLDLIVSYLFPWAPRSKSSSRRFPRGDGAAADRAGASAELLPLAADTADARPFAPRHRGISALMVVYFFLTFAQELPTTAISVILSRQLKLEPAEVTAFYAAVYVPWTIKPVYGLVSDYLPILGYRRRPWFIIAVTLAGVCYVWTGMFAHSGRSFLLSSVVASVCYAFAEVVVDSISVELANRLWWDIEHRRRAHELSSHHVSLRPTAKNQTIASLDDQREDCDSEYSAIVPREAAQGDDSVQLDRQQPKEDATTTRRREYTRAQMSPEISRQPSDDSDISSSKLPASRAEVVNQVQAACMTSRSTASVVATALSILLLTLFSERFVVACSAIVYIICIYPALWLPELRLSLAAALQAESEADAFVVKPEEMQQPVVVLASRRCRCSLLNILLRQVFRLVNALKVLWKPVVFLFVLNAMPSSVDPYSTFVADHFQNFSSAQLALFKFAGLTFALSAVLLYWAYFTKMPLRLTFLISTILAAVCGGGLEFMVATHGHKEPASSPLVSASLRHSGSSLVPLAQIVGSFFSRMALMPAVVLQARACSPAVRLEAAMFAVFSSAAHFATLLSSYLSAQLTVSLGVSTDDWSNLRWLVVISHVASLAPLLLLPLVDAKKAAASS